MPPPRFANMIVPMNSLHLRSIALLLLGAALAATPLPLMAAQRIVSLSPHITELLFAAGAGDQIVGADLYSDYPEQARRIPRVGDVAAIDTERLLALKPTLVIVWQSGTPARQQEQLRRLGLKLFATEQRHLADIESALVTFGALAGTPAVAAAAAAQLHRGIAEVRERFAGRRRLTVFYQIWDRPLFTLSQDHVVSEVLNLCGGDNVFGDVAGIAPMVDTESVLARNPEVIIIGATGADGERQRRSWLRFGNLRAVQQGRIYLLDPSLINRMTPRILLGIDLVCRQLDQARLRSTGAAAALPSAVRR